LDDEEKDEFDVVDDGEKDAFGHKIDAFGHLIAPEGYCYVGKLVYTRPVQVSIINNYTRTTET
jgi:hypothetical protein